jgi:hypothetical protein
MHSAQSLTRGGQSKYQILSNFLPRKEYATLQEKAGSPIEGGFIVKAAGATRSWVKLLTQEMYLHHIVDSVVDLC